MKYVIALLLGMLTGVTLFALGLYFNPFFDQAMVSPLALTDEQVLDLSFSAVPGDGLLFTDSGASIVTPIPARVAELEEPAIAQSTVFVTMLQDIGGADVGVGIKIRSLSERTSLMQGEVLADSTWHVYLPGKGTLLIEQTENDWSYLRDIVVPARWNSADSWRGSFFRVMTSGPGANGAARVTGGSGLFAGLTFESVETLNAAGYSAQTGPVSMRGKLTVGRSRAPIAQD